MPIIDNPGCRFCDRDGIQCGRGCAGFGGDYTEQEQTDGQDAVDQVGEAAEDLVRLAGVRILASRNSWHPDWAEMSRRIDPKRQFAPAVNQAAREAAEHLLTRGGPPWMLYALARRVYSGQVA